jgi:hypothetical protein
METIMDKRQQDEAKLLLVLEATDRASVYAGAAVPDIASVLKQMGHAELHAGSLSRLLTVARKAGLLEYGPVFDWRCWYLTSAGRTALAHKQVSLP